jgi:hypothetical protein
MKDMKGRKEEGHAGISTNLYQQAGAHSTTVISISPPSPRAVKTVWHSMLNMCKACELPRLARLNEVALPLTKGEAWEWVKTSPVNSSISHQLAEIDIFKH